MSQGPNSAGVRAKLVKKLPPSPEAQGQVSPDAPRLALIIGNEAYEYNLGSLPHCEQDAESIAKALEKRGFTVKKLVNLGQAAFVRALAEWLEDLKGATLPPDRGKARLVASCFFSGHGCEIDGENYLVPVDAPSPGTDKDRFKAACISVRRDILEPLCAEFDESILTIFFGDCCRDVFQFSSGKGLTAVSAIKGTACETAAGAHRSSAHSRAQKFIGYAVHPGEQALSGSDRCPNHSPFTFALKECLGDDALAQKVADARACVMCAAPRRRWGVASALHSGSMWVQLRVRVSSC